MGRAFEYRKARKMKRWASMSKTFTRITKDIIMAVKEGGDSPDANYRLKALIQNAKDANMPKDNVERAIKKASSKDQADYKEVVYEGYAPHGIAVLVETATDNNTRTVANVRSYFNKCNGSLGTSGSVDFMFERKCHFKIAAEGIDVEEFELEMIDYGVEEIFADHDEEKDLDIVMLYGPFAEYGNIAKGLDEKGIEVLSSGFERIPMDTKTLTPEQQEDVDKLIERIEEDDDVQAVYTNMA
ncbi:MAG: YebC/PmpR family DNA-binding transcriptional regulator [Bacteroidetes bacterium]|uniref:Probable transcriptional regulatory protein F8C82_00415 n=1 Tax=Phaeocystidibacter marisrubri TaxID=1577780 RepID=A0A6L3ZGA8_9FLAO|nr:YebC/PmpR family DNA-binding transcriptional regulator [Phaeocystidibacter marisrubri]KAB2816894.1 YebC/PmpR family DNA-binding transcriptional regulator [Phaeocystidibacter marisrubri]TNE27507.1 MAG: YebC/PmpR family DNA-binding transcriptional regulator [Bacteroidota bacterium]